MELQTFKLTLVILSNISNFTVGNTKNARQSEGPDQAVVVITVLVTGSVSFITITGNILVMLSITINRNLQTINNYFLFSLACADLIIGVSSMNLYTAYMVLGYWPLGPVLCDLWLVVDYVASYASSLSLLIISFDRYFCVTKPLSYLARRTPRIAGMMIGAAWVVSFLVWAPVILLWQFIEGERTVPEDECHIQILYNATMICIIAILLFYLPVAIMSLLYWQVSRASKSRVKRGKQEPNQGNSSCSEAGSHITIPCDDGYVKTHLVQSQNGGTGGVRENESSLQVHPERTEIAEAPTGYEGNPAAHGLNATIAKQRPKKKAPPSREKKVTQTIMAILVAFVVTWTPYHVMLLINPFCSTCVPSGVWMFGYWFLFINSTVNPACYALCNDTFKKTFKQLLLCQHKDIRLG